jgi:pimeloyl-ACP methyl ester carboxylesterase
MRVEVVGSGPRVVLVHGSMSGPAVWSLQRPLAERWTLEIVARPGFAPNPPEERIDFDRDAPLVAEQLGDGAHLVGHSYGGVVSLLAAALRPEAVWSLTVVEPPAFAVARGHPAVEDVVAAAEAQWATGPRDPRLFALGFLEVVGSSVPLPDPLPPALEQSARALMAERLPSEAEIPLPRLAATTFPKLVVSGAHHAAFDAVCDVLERALDAERAVVAGAGHSIPRTGEPFNRVLEDFLTRASLQGPTA